MNSSTVPYFSGGPVQYFNPVDVMTANESWLLDALPHLFFVVVCSCCFAACRIFYNAHTQTHIRPVALEKGAHQLGGSAHAGVSATQRTGGERQRGRQSNRREVTWGLVSKRSL